MTMKLWQILGARFRASVHGETGRLVAFTALSGVMVQVGRPLASLVTIPILLAQLGPAGLGVWMIALSLMALVSTLNSGLSITLVTCFGRVGKTGDPADITRLATAGTIIAIATALIALILCLPAIWIIDWTDLLDLQDEISGADIRHMLTVLAATMAFGFFASVPRQIMMGRLHGYIAHAFDLAGIIVGSAALIVGVLADQPLWVLALCFMGPSPFLLFFGGVVYLHRAGISLFAPGSIDSATVRDLGKDSMRMVGYHTAYSISSQTDLFLIGALVGASASAVYGVAQRVFWFPILLAQAVNQAQWPALARADAAGDRAAFNRSLHLTLAILVTMSALAGALIVLVYVDLIDLWLGRALETDFALLVGMAIWVPLAVAVSIYDTALRAQNATAYLARSMFVMAAVNIAASILFIHMIGYAGALWGTIAGYTLALLIPFAVRQHTTRSRDTIGQVTE